MSLSMAQLPPSSSSPSEDEEEIPFPEIGVHWFNVKNNFYTKQVPKPSEETTKSGKFESLVSNRVFNASFTSRRKLNHYLFRFTLRD